MKEIILDGKIMTSVEVTHDYIKNTLDFPNYYGGNLDALWDVLTTISKPLKVILINKIDLENNLGAYGEKLLEVFLEAEEENNNFSFETKEKKK
ncbi:barstar family protein [Clostridium grantii]|uniref:Ribonuclease inhibitor n=1 Tax=Clostridium grantii DSM 8605 TaxID=1121316 RepID=A0A1M5QZR6_9CLOT|nr:barstar family protein [Clostridium grantii]SHH19033.1 ribonuclease inhibitor [Clostridium grantii DSM 8605]